MFAPTSIPAISGRRRSRTSGRPGSELPWCGTFIASTSGRSSGRRASLSASAERSRSKAPELTIEKLVGVYRVLIPHKIAAYTYHLNNTSTITDAPTIRSLKFILQDEFDDWRDGEMLVQSLIETPDDVERAARHQVKLETLMVAAGGVAGPRSIGSQQEAVG